MRNLHIAVTFAVLAIIRQMYVTLGIYVPNRLSLQAYTIDTLIILGHNNNYKKRNLMKIVFQKSTFIP